MRIRVHLITLTCMGTLMLCAPNLQGASANQELSNFSASLNELAESMTSFTKKHNAEECPLCSQWKKLLCAPCGYCACADCWYNWVDSKIRDDKIPCLNNATCHQNISNPSLQLIQKESKHPEFIKRRTDILTKKNIDKDPTKKRCTKRDCDGVLDVPKPKKGIIACPKCGQPHCFDCGFSHDKSKSCDDFQKTLDQKTRLYEKFSQKKCPYCGAGIAKIEGCSHMHCSCGREFCWFCLGDPQICKSGFWSCPKRPSSDCYICKEPLSKTDKGQPFLLHRHAHNFAAHSVHTQCLLEWLEVQPDGTLLFDPKDITEVFYNSDALKEVERKDKWGNKERVNVPATPSFAATGMFPCPNCGLKTHFELSDDKKKLIFQDIYVREFGGGESGNYHYQGLVGKPRELVLAPDLKLDFFATPELFEKAVQKTVPGNQGVQALYRAFYNRINELWGKTNRTATNPTPEAIAEAKKYLPAQSRQLFVREQHVTTYAKSLIESVLVKEDIVEFFKQLLRDLPLLTQPVFTEALWVDMNKTPLWPLKSLIATHLDAIKNELELKTPEFANFLAILATS